MHIAFDQTALLLLIAALLGFFLLQRLRKQYPPPHLLYPDLLGVKQVAKGWRLHLKAVPRILLYSSLALFALAFVNPRLLIPRSGTDVNRPQKDPSEGIAIYLLLDQSGSMAEHITLLNSKGQRESISKIDLLKEVTLAFIKGDKKLKLAGRPNDMIGIVALARKATVLSPLTLDHQAILDKIAHLSVFSSPDEAGTVLGYGIFKTANLIAETRHYAEQLSGKNQPAYNIKNTIVILVTDGFQEANPLDQNKPLRTMEVPDAAAYARQVGVKLYIISIDPALAAPEYEAVRKQMQSAAELTGGKYYLIQEAEDLADIYSDIDRLQKSALPSLAVSAEQQPSLYNSIFLFPLLVAIGLVALFISQLLDTIVLRRVP